MMPRINTEAPSESRQKDVHDSCSDADLTERLSLDELLQGNLEGEAAEASLPSQTAVRPGASLVGRVVATYDPLPGGHHQIQWNDIGGQVHELLATPLHGVSPNIGDSVLFVCPANSPVGVILGILAKASTTAVVSGVSGSSNPVIHPIDPSTTHQTVTVDGKRIEIEGRDEVVLKCGEASITLRRNGRVIIRGIYVESHSKGTNRIKGGSVQIN